jgi:hypothetical protein
MRSCRGCRPRTPRWVSKNSGVPVKSQMAQLVHEGGVGAVRVRPDDDLLGLELGEEPLLEEGTEYLSRWNGSEDAFLNVRIPITAP